MKRSYSEDHIDTYQISDSKVKSSFLSLCRQLLPRKLLPIKLGDTGYLRIDKHVLSQGNGWCLDEYGRTAIVLNNLFLFQRYKNKDVIVKASDGQTFTEATCTEIRELLSLLQ